MTNKNNPPAQQLFYSGFWSQFRLRIHAYYKRVTKNPKWLLMFVLGRFKTTRSIVAFFARRPLTQEYAVDDSIFGNFNIEHVVESLKRDGFYLKFKLPESILQEILNFTTFTNCYGDEDYQSGFLYTEKQQVEEKYGKAFVRGDYFNISLDCTAIRKLASDPQLLAIAAKYLLPSHCKIRAVKWRSHEPNSSCARAAI